MKKRIFISVMISCFLLGILVQNTHAQFFSGRVYEGTTGTEPPTSKPIPNVKIKLYGSNNKDPIGTGLDSTYTDANGWYSLRIPSGWEYYNLKEFDKSGYYSDGAKAVTAEVVNKNRIRFEVPLEDDTLTGNKFWDKPLQQKNNPPVSDPNGPYSCSPGHWITLDGSGSYDPDPGDYIVKYEWDLNNMGTFIEYTTGPYLNWVPAVSTPVKLRVTDTHGATDIDSTTFTLTEGEGGQIEGTKFNDINGNKIREAGEPGMSGWLIWAEQDGNGQFNPGEDSCTTKGNGNYAIKGLAPGAYYVYEYKKSGWTQTYPTGVYHTVNIASGQVVQDVDFGNYQRTEQQDELDYGDAPDSYKTIKASNGPYHSAGGPYFGNAPPDLELDGSPTTLADGDDIQTIDDEDGVQFPMDWVVGKQTYFNFSVKNPTGSSYHGGFWVDLNMDGDFEDIQDISVYFAETFTPLHAVVVYNIPNTMAIGNTYARFRVAQGDSSTLLPYGDGGSGEIEDYQVTIKAEGDTLPAGGIIMGIKWHDIDGDGAWDNDEEPLPNWTIWLDANQNGVKDSEIGGGDQYAKTDAKGSFIFTGVPAGSYLVGEENPHGWIQTFPGGDYTYTISVQESGINKCAWFGNRQEETEEKLFDWGDAPDPTFPTLAVSLGAHHQIDPDYFLGASVDPDPDGQPHPTAEQDDLDGNDDEDGVVFNTPLVAGQTVQVTVTASAQAHLNAWIDFNGNGTWGDAGEQVFTDELMIPGPNSLSFLVPGNAIVGQVFSRFRYSLMTGLSYSGYAPEGEVEDYQVTIYEEGGEPEPGEGAIKWIQPPLRKTMEDTCYFGWDEPSFMPDRILADDWFCKDPRPVTSITWWGSYAHWDSTIAPPFPYSPSAFWIGLWTDVPRDEILGWSHPGLLVWTWFIDRVALNEHPVGYDFMPEEMDYPETCFQYDFQIPKPDWFYQEGDSTIYWLSIAAIYELMPEDTIWGWKTREHYFHDDAVRIFKADLQPGGLFEEGEPMAPGWDLAFMLGTDIYTRDFDFGDTPEFGYGTFFEMNGPHHFIDPSVRLGNKLDVDPDGQPHPEAEGDDNDGNDDEDGVLFTTNLVTGKEAKVTVSVSHHGFLNGWIDFEQDGSWAEPDDQIFVDMELSGGTHDLKFIVPNYALPDKTFARFRFSTVRYVWHNGLAIDGEVEDYQVTIQTESGLHDMGRSQIPSVFKLYPNYPNPFNLQTRISFEMKFQTPMVLKIYNIKGQCIKTLIDETKAAGKYTVEWNGKDHIGQIVPSGLYLVYFQAGEYRKTSKMILFK